MKFAVARLAAIAAVALALVLPASAAAASPARHHHHHQQRQLAEVELAQAKVVVKAIRGPANQGAPLATVRAYVYKRGSHGWNLIKGITIGAHNGWFWYPVSICSIAVTPAGPKAQSNTLTVSLLVTPAIGCSSPKTVWW